MGNILASCYEEVQEGMTTQPSEATNSINKEENPSSQHKLADLKLMASPPQRMEKYDCSKVTAAKENGVVRVRIVLSKQELAQLMSMCKEESLVEAIASKLKGIQLNNIVTSPRPSDDESSTDPWSPTLEMIPEES